MLRSIIDALPAMLFVVDKDVAVVDFNAATAVPASSQESLRGARPGHLLECIHSRDVSAGCGFGPFVRIASIKKLYCRSFLRQKKSCAAARRLESYGELKIY